MDVMGEETVMANVVQGYFDHANGKKAIVCGDNYPLSHDCRRLNFDPSLCQRKLNC